MHPWGWGIVQPKKPKLAKIRKNGNFHILSPNLDFISVNSSVIEVWRIVWYVLGVGAEGVGGAAMGVAALSTKMPKLAKIRKNGNLHILSPKCYFLFINSSVNEV